MMEWMRNDEGQELCGATRRGGAARSFSRHLLPSEEALHPTSHTTSHTPLLHHSSLTT